MEIIKLIASYGAWSWVVGGLVLLALELVVPGGVFVWLGSSAIVTGLLTLLLPIGWPLQFTVFGILALAGIYFWLRSRRQERATDSPFLNKRAERFIGHEAVIDEPIKDGFGRLVLADSVWRIAGPELAAGQKVRVIGADGAVLKVEAV